MKQQKDNQQYIHPTVNILNSPKLVYLNGRWQRYNFSVC